MAYQKTAALIAAVKLNIFSMIGPDTMSLGDLVSRTGASCRGLRILCDYLTVLGLLKKEQAHYSLTHVARTFLDKSSPFARGKIVDFVAAPEMIDLFFRDPASYVRNGGSTGLGQRLAGSSGLGSLCQGHGAIRGFKRQARRSPCRRFLDPPPYTVLDIAAGHGLYGIEVAKALPSALITAVDWAPVLTVAKANAEAAGVADQFRVVAGSAIELDWGCDFDLIFLPNFLHHFDFETCTSLLRKARAQLGC